MIDKLRNKIEEYTPIDDKHWEDIKENCTALNIKKKEVLVNNDEQSKDLFFIVSGSFEISQAFNNGDIKTVWFFLDEMFDIMGCLDSVFLGEATKYEITAIEDSTVIKFSYSALESWLKKYPYLNEFVRKDVLNGLVLLFEIRNHMASHSALEFINYLKNKFPMILDRVPDKNIAELMGITPEWYSKLKRKLNNLN
nr:Crp/Fnr family transcriptional regulator [uncultured Psychroserpens sp.]